MGECGICFGVYQEDELELHRKTCLVRLVFRCLVCNWDYVSKEGLWNHLDLHESTYESKELHYQEIKAKHKLYQCVLCNDQRAYSESSYWSHVNDVHDGFLLRCAECGENFRSEKLKNDHTQSHCKTRHHMVTLGCGVLETDQNVSNTFSVKPEPMDSVSWSTESCKSNERNEISVPYVDSRPNELSAANLNAFSDMDNNLTEKNTEVLRAKTEEKDSPSPALSFPCDICGISFSSNHAAYYHKRTKHGQMHKCPHCRRIFQEEDYQAHLSLCEKNRISCKLCDATFEIQRNLSRHMRRVHHIRRIIKKPQTEMQPALVQTFACDICGFTSSSYQNVQYHKRKDHGRNHKCPHCRSLFRIEEYKAHLLSCVKKERISCEICHSKYRTSVYLARHMKRVHSGNATINNKNCDQHQMKSSVDANDTDSSTVEKDITEKSMQQLDKPSIKKSKTKCPHCDGEYARGKSLINHIRSIHKPSKCTICDITIYGMEKARYHKVTKHTEPTFECGNCSKKFHWKADFKFHSSICDPVQTDLPGHRQARQEQSPTEEIDLNMEIKVEETTLVVPRDDCGNSSADSSTAGLQAICGGKSKGELAENKTLKFKIKVECPEEEEKI